MPFRRTYRRKFGANRRFRRYKNRRYRKGGMSRFNKRGQKTYYFKRNGNAAYEWALDGAANTTVIQRTLGLESINNYTFRATDIPNFAEFATLYDEFRIKGIKVSFIPLGNVSGWTGTTGATGTFPTYSVRSYSALDFQQDNTAINSVSQIREYQNCKWKPYNKIHSRYFYPRAQFQNTTPGVGRYNLGGKPWFSTQGSQGMYWDGLIFGVDASGAPTGTILYQIETKFYLQFRVPR